MSFRRLLMLVVPLAGVAGLAGCAPSDLSRMTTGAMRPMVLAEQAPVPAPPPATPTQGSAGLHGLITRYAVNYHVPESLVHQIVARESGYNPAAHNGPYWGLMQISLPTARTMGFRGKPAELLDADTNLRYAVKYLAGAYMVANHNEAKALRLYRSGYYYDAKRKGLLVETGLAYR